MLFALPLRPPRVPDLPIPPTDTAVTPPFDGYDDWQALPARGARLAAVGGALATAIPCLITSVLMLASSPLRHYWPVIPPILLGAAALGAWIAVKRHRLTRWKLDAHGLALRRGNWWQSETHVPASRVQHLDLRRGPLERLFGLATLVVHTAGTRLNTVAVAGLDPDLAEQLRDRLARQLDQDDDAL